MSIARYGRLRRQQCAEGLKVVRSHFDPGRLRKREKLIQGGISPYPARVRRSHRIGEAVADPEGSSGLTMELAGRVLNLKEGDPVEIELEDATGTIRLVVDAEARRGNALVLDSLDPGDWIGVRGIFEVRAVAAVVHVESIEMHSKALIDLPDRGCWATNSEAQRANRSVDLAIRPDASRVFKTRVELIRNIRRYLEEQGMWEVETPILRSWYDIVCFDQYETSDIDGRPLYMRLCHEDRLKQLVSGRFEKVFELGKSFRRDNVSPLHAPEFLQLETIQTYCDYRDMMIHAEDLIYTATARTMGRTTFCGRRSAETIDLTPPWQRVSVRDAILRYADLDIHKPGEPEVMRRELEARGVGLPREPYDKWSWSLVAHAIENFVQEHLVQPTILHDYPLGSNWLCKRTEERPDYIERFEFFIDGVEMGNCYTLTNDPVDFVDRLNVGLEECRELGQPGRPLDESLILAKAYGLPPLSESSFGIERWLLLITEQEHISDVIWMPYPYI